jgi:Fic family protein
VIKETITHEIGTPLKSENPKKREFAKKFLENNFPTGRAPQIVHLLTEQKIKQLHGMLADGLVDEKNAPAGHYRTRPIMTDMESHYPAPEDVPIAMKAFISKFQLFEQEKLNPIALASWASTQFVLVHPFSDFNGRVSRLILNAVLRSYSIPFWVSLCSTNKDRKKYLTALKHYRERKILPIATLISLQIINGFEELNNVLSLSEYALIDATSIPELPTFKTDTELHGMKWHI